MTVIARINSGCLDLEHEDGRPLIVNFEMPKELDELYNAACLIGAKDVDEFNSQEEKNQNFNDAWNKYIFAYIDILENEGVYVKKCFDPNSLSGTSINLTM